MTGPSLRYIAIIVLLGWLPIAETATSKRDGAAHFATTKRRLSFGCSSSDDTLFSSLMDDIHDDPKPAPKRSAHPIDTVTEVNHEINDDDGDDSHDINKVIPVVHRPKPMKSATFLPYMP
mmetsp:Transcript_19580/g.25888  ORF Transcript_19580/g.25888 Transcript_19580/m.25888 type:complete len:120 (-) Transcript_19580:219-578(-)